MHELFEDAATIAVTQLSDFVIENLGVEAPFGRVSMQSSRN